MAGSQGKSQAQKDRSRDNYYRRQFGITLEDYNTILAKQNGCCAVCGFRPLNGQHMNLAVDHEHFKVQSFRDLDGWVSTVPKFSVTIWAKTKAESVKLAKSLAMPKSVRGLLCMFDNRFVLGAAGRHPILRLRDNPELFTLAEKYLKNNLTNNPNSSKI
jgi:hypothetical protein